LVEVIRPGWEAKLLMQIRRVHERNINSFPNFVATVLDDDRSEFKMHFVGLFSDKKDAIPIVLLHGWPGTFIYLVIETEIVN